MSTAAELPFWPIVTASYRGAWQAIKRNFRYVFAFVLMISAVQLIIGFVFHSLIFHGLDLTDMTDVQASVEISKAFNIPVVALSGLINLVNFYFQSALYVFIIRSVALFPDHDLANMWSILFNSMTLKLSAFQIALFSFPFLVVGLPTGGAFIAHYFDMTWVALALGVVAVIVFIWIMALAMQLFLVPAYIALGIPVLKNLRSTMRKLQWRFWKIAFLLLAANVPFIIIEGGISYLFSGRYFGNANGVRSFYERFDIGHSIFSAFSQGFYLCLASLLICHLIIEVFKRVEPKLLVKT